MKVEASGGASQVLDLPARVRVHLHWILMPAVLARPVYPPPALPRGARVWIEDAAGRVRWQRSKELPYFLPRPPIDMGDQDLDLDPGIYRVRTDPGGPRVPPKPGEIWRSGGATLTVEVPDLPALSAASGMPAMARLTAFSGASGSGSSAGWLLALVAVAVVAGGIWYVRRRRR